MKFSIEASALRKALQRLHCIIPSRPFDLTNECVGFSLADGDTVRVEVQNAGDEHGLLYVQVNPDPVSAKGETLLVNERVLSGIAGSLPDGTVTFLSVGDGAAPMLRIEWANGNAYVPTFNGSFPPALGEKEKDEARRTVEIDAAVLEQALRHVLFAVADDSLRPTLSCFHLECSADGVAASVGTNANILVVSNGSQNRKLDDGVIINIPKENASHLLTILDEAEGTAVIEAGARSATVRVGSCVYTTRLELGKYPQWQGVIPLGNKDILTVDKKSLTGALRRIATAYSGEGDGTVGMTLEEGKKLTLKADNLSTGASAKESLAVQYEGEPLEIAFKVEGLLNLLNSFQDGEMTVSFSGPRRAALVRPCGDDEKRHYGIIMPCILKSNL